MISLRRRLFFILLAATGAIWLCAMAWIGIGSRSEIEQVLDTRLQEAARMVHSLVMPGAGATGAAAAVAPISPSYERQLSCQIWSFDGHLLARSSGAPDDMMAAEREGFSEREVNGERWRVYTIVDTEKGVRVVVGDRIGLRDKLVRDLLAGLAAPALLAMPLLGLLIWLSLGRGLRPLNAAAAQIAAREGEDMRPVPPDDAPSEIRPLIAALNDLLAKVDAARRHERDVTAFAAHELKTPLAGLKTQAQVALAAQDPEVRTHALRQILVSVDRSGRLVRQLLALARLEAGEAGKVTDTVIGDVLREAVDSVPRPAGLIIRLAPGLDRMVRRTDRDALALMLRNLHENAVQHSPSGGVVDWSVDPDGTGLVLTDEGPGIDADELPKVRGRFYRGRKAGAAGPASGSGLGLTIAETSAARIGARISLANRTDASGLRVQIALDGAPD